MKFGAVRSIGPTTPPAHYERRNVTVREYEPNDGETPSIHPTADRPPIRKRIASFDIIGLFLIGATWVLFIVTFAVAGGQRAWSHCRYTPLAVVLAVLLASSVAQQAFSVLTTPSSRASAAYTIHLGSIQHASAVLKRLSDIV